jgi:hypothetical protein
VPDDRGSARTPPFIDIGFTEEIAAKRGRTFLRCPIETMGLIGVEAAAVKDVVLTVLTHLPFPPRARPPA